LDYFGNFDSLYVLRGKDHRNEDKYLLPIFENAGFPARIIEFEDIPNNMRLLKNAAVVGELAHEELCALPREVLEKIIHSNLINDLRTVFLIHDKRFFSVLGNDDFLCAAMSREEAERFHAHLVPTYAWNDRRDVWEQARQNKNDWIIKPRALGKGIGVQAGLFCDDVTWRAFFLQDNASDLTMQPYIHQAMIHGQIGDEVRPKDYAVGTLLFFDDNFFGPGFFRASSHPVTNQGDDRKIAPVVAALVDELDQGMAI
jgi:hypothetical protein